jgi:hypothetical protein
MCAHSVHYLPSLRASPRWPNKASAQQPQVDESAEPIIYAQNGPPGTPLTKIITAPARSGPFEPHGGVIRVKRPDISP